MDQTELDVAQRPRCSATTKDGTRCSRRARAGAELCRQHGGQAAARTPTGITPEQTDELVALLRDGVPREQALVCAGVSRTTFYNWLSRADAADASDEYRAFAAAISGAEARWEADMVGHIAEAAKAGDARAAMWMLERRAPSRYAKTGVRSIGQMRLPTGGDVAGSEDDTPDNVVPLRPPGVTEADW